MKIITSSLSALDSKVQSQRDRAAKAWFPINGVDFKTYPATSTLIVASSGNGKSTLVETVTNNTLKQNKTVLIISVEMETHTYINNDSMRNYYNKNLKIIDNISADENNLDLMNADILLDFIKKVSPLFDLILVDHISRLKSYNERGFANSLKETLDAFTTNLSRYISTQSHDCAYVLCQQGYSRWSTNQKTQEEKPINHVLDHTQLLRGSTQTYDNVTFCLHYQYKPTVGGYLVNKKVRKGYYNAQDVLYKMTYCSGELYYCHDEKNDPNNDINNEENWQ